MGNRPTLRFEDDNLILQFTDNGLVIQKKLSRSEDDVVGSFIVLDAVHAASFAVLWRMGTAALDTMFLGLAPPPGIPNELTGLVGFLSSLRNEEDGQDDEYYDGPGDDDDTGREDFSL